MFAKDENGLGAICLSDYGGIKKYAKVPVSNELYAQVNEWLKDNDWMKVPIGFWGALTSSDQAEALRTSAYADSLTGSDRLFIQYQAALANGSADAEAKKQEWLDRREEIKSLYPV